MLKFMISRLRGLEAKLANVQSCELSTIQNTVKVCRRIKASFKAMENTPSVVVVGIFSVDMF